jgi:hypothetical protein
LDERGWDKYDLADYGGPNHRTTEKVLAGLAVREDVLPKIAEGLSASGATVNLTEIPSIMWVEEDLCSTCLEAARALLYWRESAVKPDRHALWMGGAIFTTPSCLTITAARSWACRLLSATLDVSQVQVFFAMQFYPWRDAWFASGGLL